MSTPVRAIETTGVIDDEHHLQLDTPLPITGSGRVRVIVLFEEEGEDIDESEWLYAAATNPAFSFLKEPEEDIYTLEDGKPFDDGYGDEG
jgi:hypothetical protein